MLLSSKEGDVMYFLDNASTTRVLDSTIEIMNKFHRELFFNPSAKYELSLDIARKIDSARETILNILNVEDFKVFFTASATEANNLALLGTLKSGKELIVSEGEHSSVYQTAKYLAQQGRIVHFIPLTKEGTVDEQKLIEAINENTGLISLIHTSNETGAINDIKKLCYLAKQKNKKLLFHTDLVQSFCKIDVDLDALGVDIATISAHKIHGPKGVGALVARKSIVLKPIVFGGGQELGVRSGTENVASIIGFASSAKEMFNLIDVNFEKVSKFRNNFLNKFTAKMKQLGLDYSINESKNSSPYILSLAVWGIRGEILLHALEARGVFIGTGSACSSHVKENRVLSSAKKLYEEIDGNIRISFEPNSCNYDIDKIIYAVEDAIKEIKK